MLKNNKAVFSNKSLTQYRIHDSNVSSLLNRLSNKQALQGIRVKKEHYAQLSNESKKFKDLYKEYELIENKASNEAWLDNYIIY